MQRLSLHIITFHCNEMLIVASALSAFKPKLYPAYKDCIRTYNYSSHTYYICLLIRSNITIVSCLPIQESLLKFGKEALSRNNSELRMKEITKQLGQAGLVLGVFAATAFAVKHIFV